MNILALDLGTSTGAAWHYACSETWTLACDTGIKLARKLRHDRTLDPRAAELWNRLEDSVVALRHVDYVIFEDVQFGKSLAQVQLWSSFRGIVWAFANKRGIGTECLETWKLKKFATGSPHADKSAMAQALVRNHPDVYTLEEEIRTVKKIRTKVSVVRRKTGGTLLSDDEVDALHLHAWATLNIKS